jgi:hypothetical protein
LKDKVSDQLLLLALRLHKPIKPHPTQLFATFILLLQYGDVKDIIILKDKVSSQAHALCST